MKKCLISPLEPCESGYRVAEVAESSFEVALPLFWVDCNDDIVADLYWYNPEDKSITLVPLPKQEPVVIIQPISKGSQTL
jgi:hypothetical protein